MQAREERINCSQYRNNTPYIVKNQTIMFPTEDGAGKPSSPRLRRSQGDSNTSTRYRRCEGWPTSWYSLWLTLMLLTGYNISTIDPLSELSPYGVRAWDNQDRKRVFYLKSQMSSILLLITRRYSLLSVLSV